MENDTITEEIMFQYQGARASSYERDAAIALILDHLGLEIVRTNNTTNGDPELQLRTAFSDLAIDEFLTISINPFPNKEDI